MFQFIIFAALFAVAAASSYKAAEYAPKYEAPKYEEVTYVSFLLLQYYNTKKLSSKLTFEFGLTGSPALQLRI